MLYFTLLFNVDRPTVLYCTFLFHVGCTRLQQPAPKAATRDCAACAPCLPLPHRFSTNPRPTTRSQPCSAPAPCPHCCPLQVGMPEGVAVMVATHSKHNPYAASVTLSTEVRGAVVKAEFARPSTHAASNLRQRVLPGQLLVGASGWLAAQHCPLPSVPPCPIRAPLVLCMACPLFAGGRMGRHPGRRPALRFLAQPR